MKEVIGNYNFFVITDRMDESLVAMLYMLLRIDTGDIRHLSTKITGTDTGQKCNSAKGFRLPHKMYTSPAVEKIQRPMFGYSNELL